MNQRVITLNAGEIEEIARQMDDLIGDHLPGKTRGEVIHGIASFQIIQDRHGNFDAVIVVTTEWISEPRDSGLFE